MSVTVIQENAKARVDIVFVHGLKSEQEDWTAENSVFWPEKLLPAVVPDARILKYEYDEANVESFFNEDDLISEISDTLLDKLKKQRKGELEERPVFFVAHCLGGLVVEHALCRAALDKKHKALVNCVRGVLLLGTPHYQTQTLNEAAKYFQLAQQEPPSNLEAKSQHVMAIPQSFAQLRQQTDFDIVCFYAGAPTKVNDQDIKVVDASVASVPNGPPHKRLASNHHGISRFDSEKNKDFEKVSSTLEDWVEDLPEPEEKGTVNNISNASFAGSTNSGYQLGQNVGNQTGFVFGR